MDKNMKQWAQAVLILSGCIFALAVIIVCTQIIWGYAPSRTGLTAIIISTVVMAVAWKVAVAIKEDGNG